MKVASGPADLGAGLVRAPGSAGPGLRGEATKGGVRGDLSGVSSAFSNLHRQVEREAGDEQFARQERLGEVHLGRSGICPLEAFLESVRSRRRRDNLCCRPATRAGFFAPVMREGLTAEANSH